MTGVEKVLKAMGVGLSIIVLVVLAIVLAVAALTPSPGCKRSLEGSCTTEVCVLRTDPDDAGSRCQAVSSHTEPCMVCVTP